METTTLSDRIETILAEQGISATKFAEAAGVSDSAVTLWRSGGTESMKATNALMIQRKYGYAIEWIVTGEGPKTVAEAQRLQAQEAIDQKICEGTLIDISQLSDAARQSLAQLVAAFTAPPP